MSFFDSDEESRKLASILARDSRYAPAAYDFTRRAVTFASHIVFAHGKHVSGRELLEAIRLFALERFGLLAADVLEAWGVRKTEDFGVIVFHLVDAELLSKTENDCLEDFQEAYEFSDVFSANRSWESIRESMGAATLQSGVK